ncbi:histidine kinase [Flavitalea sp. BT771]|uniref:sensor histidine kinase n=1 Tax=Flavitalea sp. BT771 TaxID=3063329 RepID=UPI0026E145F1|nr:histidine kinase [Flavitalea sp. BT771]MDO6431424.1 histidine kinase [Flavitalea sp. BT771]MDV6220332.1 histidine kinase [Flavitalea sp. BT771]
MKPSLFLLIIALITLSYSALSQEYSYTHYDISDGLAGSTAYCIVQDKEGFMWIGTETGLSRFDGTHFVSFTTADGLPDMEVLQMFCDSRGRVWMGAFHSSICYYYKGKIHNQHNDTLLQKIHCANNIEGFAEDRDGNILLQEQKALHIITPEGSVTDYKAIDGKTVDRFYAVGGGDGNSFVVMADEDFYRLSNGRFSLLFHAPHSPLNTLGVAVNSWLAIWHEAIRESSIRSLKTGKFFHRPFEASHFTHESFGVQGDSLIYENTATGVIELNVNTGRERTYLPGVQVSRTYSDDEGNLWFSTVGQGIYRLNSNEIRNMILPDLRARPCAAIYINKVGSELLIGANHEMIFRYPLPEGPLQGHQVALFTYGFTTFVDRTLDGGLVYGCHDHMGLATSRYKEYKMEVAMPVKVAVRKNTSELIIGNGKGLFLLDIMSLKIKDTLWRERCTALFLDQDTLYFGTLNGLYKLCCGRPPRFLGDSIPFLHRRISSIAVSKGHTIWVATYDAGVIGLVDGKPQAYLTVKQGLSSDICRALATHDNELWVGTDKGLNKVDISRHEYSITHYTAKDGLASNMINTVYVAGQTVFAGTPEGMSYFNATNSFLNAGCRLVLLGITNAGRDRLPDTPFLQLRHTENNIRFDFAGISYKSTGNITYRYRLIGLDSNWKSTKETFLEYPTLPFGDYELQLAAVNKFGVESGVRSIRFNVDTPFWRTTWFYMVILLSFLSLTWLFVSLRIRSIRRQQEEKEMLNTRLMEMEHVALQAQMNPHFIFNCLNSIQQYVFDQDVFAANKYITGFAKLIRATLNNSTKAYITLADEIDYLSTYLSLEKLRFKEKMNYSIEVAPSLKHAQSLYIPPMILQPYVENCMRHGLRHRRSAGGYIRINISQEERLLVFAIEDNGIGREKAASYKTREHIEYQSRGMSLTADRIRLINAANEEEITVEIIDLKEANGEASGTRVIVKFPKFDPAYQKHTI